MSHQSNKFRYFYALLFLKTFYDRILEKLLNRIVYHRPQNNSLEILKSNHFGVVFQSMAR